jgi:hypothetical protein
LRERESQTSVFWVHASNIDRFKQGYAEIAKKINIPGADDPAVSILGLVKSWLMEQGCGQWLMIIDNADDVSMFFGISVASAQRTATEYEQNLARFIPRSPKGSILFTTRNKQLGLRLTGSGELTYIPPMQPREA